MQNGIIGHKKILNNLLGSAKTGRHSHAYIFSGPEGVGKKTVAKSFVDAIMCDNGNACGVCESCILNKYGNHPDVSVISTYETNIISKKDNLYKNKKSISVDAVRDAKKDIYIKPVVSKQKVYVICDGDKLTAEGQNSLLKVLEEPPAYCTIIITATSTEAILDTVLSRAVKIDFFPLSNSEMEEYINTLPNQDSARARSLIAPSRGCIGKLISLMNDDNIISLREEAKKQLLNLVSTKKSDILKACDFISQNKEFCEFIFDFYISVMRDAAMIKFGDENLIVNIDSKNEIVSLAQKLTIEQITGSTERLAEIKRRIVKTNANVNLCVMSGLIGLLK